MDSTDSQRKRVPDLEVDVPASFAGFAHPEFLVETEWLEAHLGQSDLRILDCTVHIVFDPQAMFTIAPGRDDFERGHIPGAQFVDLLTELSDMSHPVPLMAPSPAQFASVMSRLGVENGCRVILYSAQNAYWATRVWWLFRVFGFDNAALLNGGWQRWRREERPIETGPARQPPPARFNVSELRPLMASKADVRAAIADPAVCIINALPEDQFLFTSGVHYGRPGHITGSLNVPSEDLLDSETNEFLPAAELRRRFERVSAFERPVITYCGGAIAASADAMALVMLGHPDVKLYDGSLLEWAADPSLPVEVDPIPTSSTQALAGIDNKRLLSELRDALDRQIATTEVLQVINRSPGNLAPVFEAILERALRLCEADFGVFWAYDGRQFRAASGRGTASELAEVLSRGPYEAHLDSPHARALAGEPLVHIADISGEGLYQSGIDPLHRALVDLGGARTVLAIPLRRDASLLGILTLYRREVRLFADKHIVLLQSFAEQALVAMENARLITETREALEQQTATAEVLQVINSSPGELAPVFDAVLEKATELCEAAFGILRTWDGEHFHQVAFRGAPPALEAYWREPQLPTPGTVAYRLAQGENCVVIPDVREDQAYRDGARGLRALVELADGRSYACVALRKDGRLFGALTIYRTEVRPFSDKQIALLQNFAAQAVIAMENARLLTETREALAQQTATAEVLQVINSSPGDLAPVFDAVIERAMRLCEATQGHLYIYADGQIRAEALRGGPQFVDWQRRRGSHHVTPGSPTERALHGEQVIHIADATQIETYRSSAAFKELIDRSGIRTGVTVALRRDDAFLGTINIYRQEVRPFTEKQITLLQNFAAQAVIAIENARLITETREALEQQTATAEVLQVINSSPGDLTPVFWEMLQKATRLCDAPSAILWIFDGEFSRAAALHGIPEPYAEYLRQPIRLHSETGLARAISAERTVVSLDLAAEEAYRTGNPQRRAFVDLGRARTAVRVPLLKEGKLLGIFTVYRHEVRPFTDKQIALLENFAAQAVIAMENARLINETREALEQQTATTEVLQVINSSPGDLAPVFDAILEKAHSLCGIASGSLELYDGENFRSVAERGLPKAFADMLREGYPASDNPATRPLIEGNRFTHIADLAETDYTITQSAAELLSARTLLCIPLRRENLLLGMIACARQEVRLFSEKEIALLESFAAQAVIAMDNARLLDEIRQRQAELRVTFDNMGDGVAMFDSGLRLAAWNQNFQRILDLPDALLAARPSYADYIRFLAERGEFGADIEAELTRRLEEIGQELRFEHTRPDSRVIEVRRNAVPGGGFVVIYGDVTERKRAEEKIRTARDAAERALRELQAAQASLLHAQKMAALGQLTAGIAHEIKNPLNFVNNFAGLSVELLDELKETTAPAVASLGEETRAEIDEIVGMLTGNLAKIAEHGKRADGIVQSMLAHSRGTSGDRQRIDINALVEEALNLAYHGARAQDQNFNITLERDLCSMAAPVEVVPQDVLRVFLNLIGNGFYAANKRASEARDPAFKPSLKVITRDLGTEVEVRVRDNGTGIAPEAREKLFQPFFTTKPTGEGTGLGLSISWDIITQQHGGTIALDSRAGEFTEFTIRLPRTHLRAAEAAS